MGRNPLHGAKTYLRKRVVQRVRRRGNYGAGNRQQEVGRRHPQGKMQDLRGRGLPSS